MQGDKMKICFITPNLGKGGMERFLSIMTKEVSNIHEVIIITLINNHVEYAFDDKIKIIHINDKWDGNIIKVFFSLYKLLRSITPDVVIGFSEVFNPLTILVSKLNKLKVFISDRSNPLMRHKLRDRISRTVLYPFSDGIIAQTDLAKNTFLKKKFNKNICVIPNPLIEFRDSKIDPTKKYIITSGRLEISKNQGELLDIFSKVVRDDWKLIIIGDGSQKIKLEKKAKLLGISEKVNFVGKQNDIEFWLNKGSIYIYTSLSEGFPNALSEAIATPLASIAYDCPAGVSDLIEDGENGFLIPLGNQDIFINKLNMLIDSERLREKFMREGIKSRHKYKANNIALKLVDFITS